MSLEFKSGRKGTIGQILTSFPSLIIVFIIMLFFVIVSGFISKERLEKYSLIDDFLDDWIELNGDILRVSEAINEICIKLPSDSNLSDSLREHFKDKFQGSSFLLVIKEGGTSTMPPVSKPYSWFGGLGNNNVPQLGPLTEGVETRYFCSSRYVELYVKSNYLEGVL